VRDAFPSWRLEAEQLRFYLAAPGGDAAPPRAALDAAVLDEARRLGEGTPLAAIASGAWLLARVPPPQPPALLERARQLFTRALETPGGLKIQTIHAFCERVLQLFPVEAGVVPHFTMLDDREQLLLLQEARNAVLSAAKERAVREKTSIGQALTGLARAGLAAPGAVRPGSGAKPRGRLAGPDLSGWARQFYCRDEQQSAGAGHAEYDVCRCRRPQSAKPLYGE
jgi:hypothetical protein